jgi:hypothetical protein
MSAQDTLGKLIDDTEQRDAVHFALAPVYATVKLAPGQAVGFINGTQNAGPCSDPVGIVDPFLKHWVRPGERFWMFLNPNSITGLRHEWTHPAYTAAEKLGRVEAVTNALTGREDARKWLMKFAAEWGMDYELMIQTAAKPNFKDDWNNYITAHGSDLHNATELGDDHPKFWENLERLTGQKFDEEHRGKIGWSCSC